MDGRITGQLQSRWAQFSKQSPSRPAARIVNAGRIRTRTPSQKEARAWGAPYRAEQCLAVVRRRTWQKYLYGQGLLDDDPRCLRGAERWPPEDSTGRVPRQSG